MASLRAIDIKASCAARGARSRSVVAPRCQAFASSGAEQHSAEQLSRRQLIAGSAVGLALSLSMPAGVQAASAPPEPPQKQLCDAACTEQLEASTEMVTLPSGLQYRDIVVGKGPKPQVGYQVVAHYVAMTTKYRIFDNSLEKGMPYDIRVGAGQVIPGLDEGLLTMRVGGIRRLYIPGPLSFPKGLKAAAGRPSVPAASPVIFDVQLLYIPGLEDEDE